MIIDKNKLYHEMSNFIKTYAETHNIKTLIVGLSGGIDSALAALLCKQTDIPTICVYMGCNSSVSSYERAKNFCKEYKLDFKEIDFTNENESIFYQVCDGLNLDTDKVFKGYLGACIRTSILAIIANMTKGIIVGTNNKSEIFTGYYQKYGDGCADILPMADLFKSEIYELFKFAASVNSPSNAMMPSAEEIYKAIPSADLLGPDESQSDEKDLGMTYDEIEWVIRENERTKQNHNLGIIESSSEDPCKFITWPTYSSRQKQLIVKMHRLYKLNKHKINPAIPKFEVRNNKNYLY